VVFIRSLAGIIIAGFFGQVAVFAAALKLGAWPDPTDADPSCAILLSEVALYYTCSC